MNVTFKWQGIAFMAIGFWLADFRTPAEGSEPGKASRGTMEETQPPLADEIISAEAALAAETRPGEKSSPSEKRTASTSKKTEPLKPEGSKTETVTEIPAPQKEGELQSTETSKILAPEKPEGKEAAVTEVPAPKKEGEQSTETSKILAPEKPEGKEAAVTEVPAPKKEGEQSTETTKTSTSEHPGNKEAAFPETELPAPRKEGESQTAAAENQEAVVKSETAPAKPTAREIGPAAERASSESPFIGTVVLMPFEKKFVVVDFRNGEVPPIRSELGVYRGGVFVGSVRITDPVKPPLASADILTGKLQRGDIVQ